MRIKINLSVNYDLDLIAYCDNGQKIGPLMARSAIAYANNENYSISLAPCQIINKKARTVYVNINDEKTLLLLSNLVPGQKTAFLKHCFRVHLITPNSACYFSSPQQFTAPTVDANINDTKTQPIITNNAIIKTPLPQTVKKGISTPNKEKIKEITNEPAPIIKETPAPNADVDDFLAAFDNL